MAALLPLTFQPIFQSYLWGGRRLATWFEGVPAEGPIAEAWLLSDEAKFPSRVAGGPLAGQTLRQLMDQFSTRLVGAAVRPGERFPLLLKLLDARDRLSVQVHPNDQQAAKISPELRGKTEAWVVLDAEPGACLYAGLKPGADEAAVRQAIAAGQVDQVLHSFEPKVGDCIFLPAGTIHAIGSGLLLFEVQQTSDLTFRLHDWGRVDPRTGQSRPLHIDESLACINYGSGPSKPSLVVHETESRQRLVSCDYFRLWRIESDRPFTVGASGGCRVVVAVAGRGRLNSAGDEVPLRPGATWLLPAECGPAECCPDGLLTILECGLPERSASRYKDGP